MGRLNNFLPEAVLRRSDHLSDVATGEGALDGDGETVGVTFQPLRKPERFREKNEPRFPPLRLDNRRNLGLGSLLLASSQLEVLINHQDKRDDTQ